MEITFAPLGDGGVLAYTSGAVALHAALSRRRPPGVTESVPADGCVAVLFDPLRITREAVEAHVRWCARGLSEERLPEGRGVRIPVRYDGPDLHGAAELAGLSVRELIGAHAAASYRVAFLGFLPGFAYLAGLPDALRLPRRAEPRTRVPAGSVAIGGPWASVYPSASPGGWHLLGSTDVRLFDPAAPDPVRLRPGDEVHFDPV